jgi:hypothetical protein
LACIHWWSGAEFGHSILPPTAQAHLYQHKIPHALVGFLKSEGKILHDRMDVLAKVIDFLHAKKLVCQN